MTEQLYCANCQKPTKPHHNYCDWKCMIESAKAGGGKVFTPNGLPIRSIKWDGNMYEHSHGDHPDYIFPVKIDFVGEVKPESFEDLTICFGVENPTEDDARRFLSETHALIYTDGCIAITLYECNYAMWSCRTGEYRGGRFNSKSYKLSDSSLEEIRSRRKFFVKKKRPIDE